MSTNTLGDFFEKSKSKEVDPIFKEVSILKQLIKERVHELDLVREMLSNSGAKEVGATNIEISYTKDKQGHIFEIEDDGCGMDYTGNINFPGRLDKFLGLGLSGIAGITHDEFSWKGLGSKLAFQSKRVKVETCEGGDANLYEVTINEPWKTIEDGKVPKPRLTEHPGEGKGTKIRVIGHPPHRHDSSFKSKELKTFVQHRTFAGYTRDRDFHPKIILSVLGEIIKIPFGFPEFKDIDFDSFKHDGLKFDEENQTLFVNMGNIKAKSMSVRVKGFITWKADEYNLARGNLNTGLILSVNGIPYFNLNMEDYGVTTIRTARPGENKTCLVVECDAIQDELNISRSGLVDSQKTLDLKKIVAEIFKKIESSPEYGLFWRLPGELKVVEQSTILKEDKEKILDRDQKFIVLDIEGQKSQVLIREPENEMDASALLWKLEATDALPFKAFKTLGYIGASRGPDILVYYQEEKNSEPDLATVFEIENNFYNYKTHGHAPSQYPKVICWDAPSSGRKIRLVNTDKKYKFTYDTEDYKLHVFVMKHMDGIRILSKHQINKEGIEF